MAAEVKETEESRSPPTIHEATLGSNGRVIQGVELTEAEAVSIRHSGGDVVICGQETASNRTVARQIEQAVGSYKRESPHASAGPYALPHFQSLTKTVAGHCFYETDRRKAARNP